MRSGYQAERSVTASANRSNAAHKAGADEPPDPLELYAAGIDTSDYVSRVGPLIRNAVPQVGDLLDIGSGGGQLGQVLRQPGQLWTAIEPAPVMQGRLRSLAHGPGILSSGWQGAALPEPGFDTVLAANMPAPLTEPSQFLARCRAWSRRAVVWVVPAQQGPRGLCLAGCLPRAWHGEDETPGLDIVLRGLDRIDHPETIATTEWTFTAVLSDLGRIARYLADRLGWEPSDPRRSALHAHLGACAVPHPLGYRISLPRASAVLVWRKRS